MARNQTLQDTVDAVLRETSASTNSSAGNDFRQNVKERIRSVQMFYFGEFAWPFMKLKKGDARVTLAAGQRYYDFPDNLDNEHDFTLWYQHSDVWIPLIEGIGPQDYSAFDSDDDERSEPALKWDYYDETQFEIWPIPSATHTVWFSGRKKLTALVEDGDRLDLDDRMIVLHVAADMLEGRSKEKSARLRTEAERRYWQQRGNSNVDLGVRVGVSRDQEQWPPNSPGFPRTIAVYNERT